MSPRPCPRSYLVLSLPIPFQLPYRHPAISSTVETRQSGTIHRWSYRWSERAAIRNAPSNLSLMDRDADSGILPRSPLTDNTLKYFQDAYQRVYKKTPSSLHSPLVLLYRSG